MCIRAIDYCPPVGITFGAYLRAVVTADYDINPSDRENWRLAFIESFREWGISPSGIRSMAEDSLLWPTEQEVIAEQVKVEARSKTNLETTSKASADTISGDVDAANIRGRQAITKMFQESAPPATDADGDGDYLRKASRAATPTRQFGQKDDVLTPVGLSMPRFDTWLDADKQAVLFHRWLLDENVTWLADALGLVVNTRGLPSTISARERNPDHANIEIHSVRTAMKRGPLGWPEQHMVVVVTQWRAGSLTGANRLRWTSSRAVTIIPSGISSIALAARCSSIPGKRKSAGSSARQAMSPLRMSSSACDAICSTASPRRMPLRASPNGSGKGRTICILAFPRWGMNHGQKTERRETCESLCRAGAAARRRGGSHVPCRTRRLFPHRVCGRQACKACLRADRLRVQTRLAG
ncbi:hypothetical protein AJ87_13220 [Rhizobium yanglingense]|nr:hypothetical protein AJ87_13220 [Rhizobium yanglingense]